MRTQNWTQNQPGRKDWLFSFLPLAPREQPLGAPPAPSVLVQPPHFPTSSPPLLPPSPTSEESCPIKIVFLILA